MEQIKPYKNKQELDQADNVYAGSIMESVRRHLIMAHLEACGLMTFTPSWDANGCDFGFLLNGKTYLVQQKARVTVDKKYLNSDNQIYMTFPMQLGSNSDEYYVIVDHTWLYHQVFDVWNYSNAGKSNWSNDKIAKDKAKTIAEQSIIKPFKLRDILNEVDYI